MKTLLKTIWQWLKRKVKISIDVDIYIFVNGQWIKVDIWELKTHIERQKNGINTGIEKVRYVKKGDDVYGRKVKDEDFAKIVKKSKNV